MMSTVKDYIDTINALSLAMMNGKKKYLMPSKRMVNLPSVSEDLPYAKRLCKAKVFAREILKREPITLN